jgi:serine phosphatase RsbU (regulator of sigma subunit)
MLVTVKRAIREHHELSPALWILNVFIETQLPTMALLLLIESQIIGPYHALVAPSVLLYFLFIILSTLRLSPTLSFLTGLVSSAGYIAVIVYVTNKYPVSSSTEAVFPVAVYFIYAGLILLGGVIAAVVAKQIRVHVFAALREAQVQGELKQVRHDLDIARTIQQGLLPTQSPALDNFELAGWNQPADQTGGDYFDWQALPDGRLAISLADATGHGIGPALVSASCRAYARAIFLSNGHNDLLERLNLLLGEDLSANRFVTFAVVFLEPDRSRVEILSAGHGPILWYKRAENTFENLEAQGIPLGMIADVHYDHAISGTLAVGDLLVLVTDGFYEWENPDGEEFGLTRLEDVIRASRDYTSDEIIARLRSSVALHCRGTQQKDDLTAVILKRKA